MGLKDIAGKAWKGVKGAVKKVAKGIRNVAHKVVTAIPGGDTVWKGVTKVFQGVKDGFGKMATKLGPVGMMALSVVLAPFMGPMIAGLWANFGAGAVAMAASGSSIVSALGTAGTAIFNGVNFVSGTLGAMGSAVTEGLKQMTTKGLSAGAQAFTANMGAAFSGTAGTTAMNAAAATAQTAVGTAATEAAIAANTGIQMSPVAEITAEGALSPTIQGAGGQSFVQAKDAFGVPIQASEATATVEALAAERSAMLNPLGPAPGKESSWLGDAGKAASAAGKLLDTGGAGAMSAYDSSLAARQHHETSAAGKGMQIEAFQAGNLYQNLLAQARGGFA